ATASAPEAWTQLPTVLVDYAPRCVRLSLRQNDSGVPMRLRVDLSESIDPMYHAGAHPPHSIEDSEFPPSHIGETRGILKSAVIITAVVFVAASLWQASDVVLLTCAAVLLAIFLSGIGDWLARHTGLSHARAVLVGVISLVG